MSAARPASLPDPRAPLVIDTRELGRRAGSLRRLHREVPAPAGWQLELVEVPAGAPVTLDVRLEAVLDGVLVTGSVAAPVTAQCGRCLEPVQTALEVDVQELFSYAPDPADPEAPVMAGDFLDFEPVVRDAVVLGLPLNPVCDAACAGLCAGCGVRLADVGAGHQHDETDPRWAALAGLQPTPQGGAGTSPVRPEIRS